MSKRVWFGMSTLLLGTLMVATMFYSPSPVEAQSAPDYGSYYYLTGSYTGVVSTVSLDLLAAPGTGHQWIVTGVNGQILVAEASKVISIRDHSGSEEGGAGYHSTTGTESVVICDFAPTIAGGNFYHDFGEGIECAVNSAVVLEGMTTTADVWIEIQAYKRRVP